MGVRVLLGLGLLASIGFVSACGAQGGSHVAVGSATQVSEDPSTTVPGFGTDVLGAASVTIPIDHVGDYSWVSPVVYPSQPDQITMGWKPEGDVTATDEQTTINPVQGGYSMGMTFTVKAVSGKADMLVTGLHADGTAKAVPPVTTATSAP